MTPPFIKRYLIALDRHKWAGLAGFTVVLGLSGVAALQPTPDPIYRAEGLLTYVTPPVNVSQTATVLQEQGQSLTPEVLLSKEVVDTVVQRLAAQQIEASPEQVVRSTKIGINPGADEEEQQQGFNVLIKVEDSEEQRAQATATLLMEAIVEQSQQFNTRQLDRILQNLQELLPNVESELRQAESNLEQYVRQEGPAIQAAQDGDLLGAITGSQVQQRQLRLALSGVEAQIRSLEARLGLSPGEAYTSSALSADPIIADLRARIHQSETQMAILAQTLRSTHPTMVDLATQQRAYEQLLRQRVEEVIGGDRLTAPLTASSQIRQASNLDPARQQLANTLVGLQTQRETLQQQILALAASEQQLRREYTVLPNKQLEQSRLEQQVLLKRSFYDQLQARFADVTIAKNETVGSLEVVKPASAYLATEETNNPMVILLVGGFVGLLVGGGLVMLLSSLDATFHTLPDLQNALRQQEVSVLGLLPLLPPPEDSTIPVITDSDSPYLDPFERLRTNLRRAAGNGVKLVLLTSTVNDEGKTVVAYNLAIASARAGKRTLLIEADLRSPSQARALDVAPDPEAALDPLRYFGRLNERLVPGIANLYILPSPEIQQQAAAVLESSEVRRLLEDARGRFDLVVLDTPSLSRYGDALLLEPLTDGMILVTRPGYTEEGLLTEAIEQFGESEDVTFLGAVINGADVPIQSREVSDPAPALLLDDLAYEPIIEDLKKSAPVHGKGERG